MFILILLLIYIIMQAKNDVTWKSGRSNQVTPKFITLDKRTGAQRGNLARPDRPKLCRKSGTGLG